MGNRAVVIYTVSPDVAIYLHWNGGPETVLALIEDARKQEQEQGSNRGPVAFLQSAANYTDFNGLSLYIERTTNADTNNGDNGTYYVTSDYKVTRKFTHKNAPTTYAGLNDEEKERYDYVIRDCRANRAALKLSSTLRDFHESSDGKNSATEADVATLLEGIWSSLEWFEKGIFTNARAALTSTLRHYNRD